MPPDTDKHKQQPLFDENVGLEPVAEDKPRTEAPEDNDLDSLELEESESGPNRPILEFEDQHGIMRTLEGVVKKDEDHSLVQEKKVALYKERRNKMNKRLTWMGAGITLFCHLGLALLLELFAFLLLGIFGALAGYLIGKLNFGRLLGAILYASILIPLSPLVYMTFGIHHSLLFFPLLGTCLAGLLVGFVNQSFDQDHMQI